MSKKLTLYYLEAIGESKPIIAVRGGIQECCYLTDKNYVYIKDNPGIVFNKYISYKDAFGVRSISFKEWLRSTYEVCKQKHTSRNDPGWVYDLTKYQFNKWTDIAHKGWIYQDTRYNNDGTYHTRKYLISHRQTITATKMELLLSEHPEWNLYSIDGTCVLYPFVLEKEIKIIFCVTWEYDLLTVDDFVSLVNQTHA